MSHDPPTSSTRSDRIARGVMFVLVSSVVWAPLVQSASKFLALEFPALQIFWVRVLGHTLWMVAWFWPSHGVSMFRTERPGLQFARSCLLAGCSLLWLVAIPTVPLATAAAIMFTTPIFVALLSMPLLGERVGGHRAAAIVLGFGGVLLIVRPDAGSLPVDLLLIVAGALMYALYQILTRVVARHDSAATSSVYSVMVGAVLLSFVVPFDLQLPAAGEWLLWLGFIAVGFLGGFRHLFMVKAIECAPASLISPFCYTELIGVALLGALLFGERPDVWTWSGAAVIVASGLYIAHREARAGRG